MSVNVHSSIQQTTYLLNDCSVSQQWDHSSSRRKQWQSELIKTFHQQLTLRTTRTSNKIDWITDRTSHFWLCYKRPVVFSQVERTASYQHRIIWIRRRKCYYIMVQAVWRHLSCGRRHLRWTVQSPLVHAEIWIIGILTILQLLERECPSWVRSSGKEHFSIYASIVSK